MNDWRRTDTMIHNHTLIHTDTLLIHNHTLIHTDTHNRHTSPSLLQGRDTFFLRPLSSWHPTVPANVQFVHTPIKWWCNIVVDIVVVVAVVHIVVVAVVAKLSARTIWEPK